MLTKEGGEKNNIDLPIVFWAVSVFFLISLGLLVKGYFQGTRKQVEIDKIPEKVEVNEEEPLDQFFDEGFTTGEKVSEDQFSVNDPFKKICAPTEGDGLPSISGGTVCLR